MLWAEPFRWISDRQHYRHLSSWEGKVNLHVHVWPVPQSGKWQAGPQLGLCLGRGSTLHPLPEGDISLFWPFSHMPGTRPFSGPMDPRRGHSQAGIGFTWTCVLAPALKEVETTSRCGFLCTVPGLMLHHILSKSHLNTLHLPPFTSNSHSKPWLSLLYTLWKRLDNSQ